MKLFLDTSVLLAACGSTAGASREVIRLAASNGWRLIVTPYVIDEVSRNLPRLAPDAEGEWGVIGRSLVVMDDVATLDRPTIFAKAKDRPILFSALSWADVLLTLDRADFGELLGSTFYGLSILKPGEFLSRERAASRLR